MKETINVNIGRQSFTLDHDAYQALRTYLDDVQSRLGNDDQEIMADIENRLAADDGRNSQHRTKCHRADGPSGGVWRAALCGAAGATDLLDL